MIGRAAFAVFAGIVILAVAQVAWWITFLIRIGGERRHIVMFASEGAFFMLALLAGVFLMYRTLLEQVRLRRMRATFLSAVTHELKSPIAAIRLFLETLEGDRVDEAKRRDLVRKMLLDTDRLDRLVADLLRAGQIVAGALAPALGRVDLRALAAEVVEAARPRLQAGDALDLDAGPPVAASGDRALLRSAIENLVDNAIKYSPPPRRVSVSVTAAAGDARIRDADERAGIDDAALGRAFEPFARGGNEEVRSAKGTGLGLFIVRGIAEAHGGRATIASRAPAARGTEAALAIPLGGGGGAAGAPA